MIRFFKCVFIGLLFLLYSCNNEPIPVIHIEKSTPFSWEAKEVCHILYTENNRKIKLPAQIKLRGGSSSKYFKHSFRIELDEKYALGKLPEEDDWILNATYIDKTFMRHKLSYDLFRSMNPEKNIAPRCSYVNVFLNKKYNGLYVLMEKINASLVGLVKSDTLAMLFKEPPIFYKDEFIGVRDTSNYYYQKFPKKHKKDHSNYIKEFRQFLLESSDTEFANEIKKWVDIENIIDWHLILLFSNNSDGILKNFYLYKMDSNTPFRVAIWDYDHSYGRDGDNEMNFLKRILDCNRSVLLKRLNENNYMNYNQLLSSRWRELRELTIISSENFNRLVDENHQKIKNHLEENFGKWPLNSEWYFDDNNYTEEVELMKKFVQLRVNQLDSLFGKSSN